MSTLFHRSAGFTSRLLLSLFVLLAAAACTQESLNQAISLGAKHTESFNQTNKDFTPEQEYYIGRAVAAQILTRYQALNDSTAAAYVNQLGQALALFSDQPLTYNGYHFQLLNSPEVNAFAAPGGFIFVTTGMLALTGSESELAAVLAHEIGHVQNQDAIRAIKNSRLTSAMTALGTDAAAQYGGKTSAELVNIFSDSVNDVVNTLVTNGYSRSQEYAADNSARAILSRAGYDPGALYSVLRNMGKNVKSGSAGLGSTHPSATNRLEALEAGQLTAAADPKERAARFKAAVSKYKRG